MLCVNTYSGLIHISKIANTKMDTLVQAVGEMTKVNNQKREIIQIFFCEKIILFLFLQKDKNFVDTHTLLFDGESGLNSKKAKQLIMDKYQIKVYADPKVKRNTAERGIRGILFMLFIAIKKMKKMYDFIFLC